VFIAPAYRIGVAALYHFEPSRHASQRKRAGQGSGARLSCRSCLRQGRNRKIPDLGPNHTRKCLQMPACIQGGYAILLPSNQELAFDYHGNELAQKWLASQHQEKGIVIKAGVGLLS
jgi:hypothetical protein